MVPREEYLYYVTGGTMSLRGTKRIPDLEEVAGKLGIPWGQFGEYRIEVFSGQGGRDYDGNRYYDSGYVRFFWDPPSGRQIAKISPVALLFGGWFGGTGRHGINVGPLALKLGVDPKLLKEVQEWWDDITDYCSKE